MRILGALLIWATAAAAEDRVEVDVELVLAVDVSRSMSADELAIQRRGYASALVSDEVLDAIGYGLLGRIALTYVEWASAYDQTIIVDWTLIEGRADAEDFAARILADSDETYMRTSISGALDFAARHEARNGFDGLRRVIDVSGDGPNNQGRWITVERDRLLAEGYIINGLPLMTSDPSNGRWHIENLDLYYTHCVIGGPGSFVVPVLDWDQFARAVRRKLVLEIADLAPRPELGLTPVSAVDCQIGEKMWEEFRRFWGDL